MNNDAYLYATGLFFIASISALLISGSAQSDMFAAHKAAEIVLPTGIATVEPDRLVRVILASPYGR
ncbi:MAG: hypothetical protein WD871_02590 [Xanthobacteraceae bacterium]